MSGELSGGNVQGECPDTVQPYKLCSDHNYETGVAYSDLRWRHIRHAIKPRSLGNHASQIKSYYGSLSGSHARFFRIRHEKLPEAPHGGEITMTSCPACNISYPACNKTRSLSRKPCIPDKKLIWNAIRKAWSLFQNPSWKVRAAPLAEDWQWRHIRFAIKPRYLGNQASHIKLINWQLYGTSAQKGYSAKKRC